MKNTFTIGHSNRNLDELIKILRHYKIEILVDVRSYPRSRRNPQFNRENLESELSQNGIEYVWMKTLGGLREGGFEDYMNTEGFDEGLTNLINIEENKRAVVMCAELSWTKCHRSFIASALVKKGWEVIHIFDEKESELHSGLL